MIYLTTYKRRSLLSPTAAISLPPAPITTPLLDLPAILNLRGHLLRGTSLRPRLQEYSAIANRFVTEAWKISHLYVRQCAYGEVKHQGREGLKGEFASSQDTVRSDVPRLLTGAALPVV